MSERVPNRFHTTWDRSEPFREERVAEVKKAHGTPETLWQQEEHAQEQITYHLGQASEWQRRLNVIRATLSEERTYEQK